jgi:hypothetical protein
LALLNDVSGLVTDELLATLLFGERGLISLREGGSSDRAERLVRRGRRVGTSVVSEEALDLCCLRKRSAGSLRLRHVGVVLLRWRDVLVLSDLAHIPPVTTNGPRDFL